MKNLELTVDDIKDLMETLHKHKLGSLKIEQGDFCLQLEGQKIEQITAAPQQSITTTTTAMALAATSETTEITEPAYRGKVVTSPIVGTFYSASAPDKPPYVTVGDCVKKGDVLFIIESMKLMNEVTSDYDGTITQILVSNAQGVEYGQPVLCIE